MDTGNIRGVRKQRMSVKKKVNDVDFHVNVSKRSRIKGDKKDTVLTENRCVVFDF